MSRPEGRAREVGGLPLPCPALRTERDGPVLLLRSTRTCAPRRRSSFGCCRHDPLRKWPAAMPGSGLATSRWSNEALLRLRLPDRSTRDRVERCPPGCAPETGTDVHSLLPKGPSNNTRSNQRPTSCHPCEAWPLLHTVWPAFSLL